MTPDRWQRLEDLFHDALERRPVDRPAFLAENCRDDAEMRAEVERLLRADRHASRFLGVAERVAATVVPEGQRIGAYRIVRELGRGRMGTVYLGERADAQFETRVALKLLSQGIDTDAVLQRFRHERPLLAGLEHRNIGRLLDGGTTEWGLPYFAMEYVDGQPLDEYCRAHKLTIPHRLDLFRQVCGAITYAHQHLVVHRDLKPSNILVTRDGVPKLLDFGIAKLLDPADASGTMATEIGAQALSPQYASPEQLRGERVTTASDVYALGVLLYELLVDVRPYEVVGKSPEEARQIVAAEDALTPSAAAAKKGDQLLARRLRGDLDTIVMTALRHEPAARYSSAALLADDVRRYAEGLPVLARGDSWTYRTGRFVRRRKLAVTAAAAIVLSLVGRVVASESRSRRRIPNNGGPRT